MTDEQKFLEIKEKIKKVEAEIQKGIIGQEDVIKQVLMAILADGNVLLESVPGLGKTQLVKTLSKVLALDFSRIQFTPDLMPADVTGTNLVVQEEGAYHFEFQKGPIFANLVLADEINRATPKTQSALLEAMQEKTVTASGKTYYLEEPFLVLATQNPIENEGTYPLPEAQLDRFLFKIFVPFPEAKELRKIVELTTGMEMPEIQSMITKEELLIMRKFVVEIPVADAVMDYAMRLVAGTHKELLNAPPCAALYIENGASPRAAQAIIKAAKARAFLEGRFNVAFEDIQFVAYPAMRHRLILNFDAVSEGKTADDIIKRLLEEIKVV